MLDHQMNINEINWKQKCIQYFKKWINLLKSVSVFWILFSFSF